jgi:hypothetical protein
MQARQRLHGLQHETHAASEIPHVVYDPNQHQPRASLSVSRFAKISLRVFLKNIFLRTATIRKDVP